jgi:hypothetical protein
VRGDSEALLQAVRFWGGEKCDRIMVSLRLTEPDRILYLAIPVDVYNEFFSRRFIQRIITEYELKLLIFNPEQEEDCDMERLNYKEIVQKILESQFKKYLAG